MLTGSLIWNVAEQHREVIHQHSFWEIMDVRMARLWMDSWKQRPKIAELLPCTNHNGSNINQEDNVEHFQTLNTIQGFRQWKPSRQITRQEMKAYNMELHKELTNRRIKVNTRNDVLIWGYTPKGIYTTKEAYQLMFQTQEPTDPAWNRIWTTRIWPKVSTFICLLYHQRILTWDNLIKREFQGPSYCPNCQNNEETIQHLMDSFHMANQLWEKLTFRCQRLCILLQDIKGTIFNQTPEPYNNKVLNKLSEILLGLLLWTIWKERNKRIFKNHKNSLEVIWTNLCQNIKETLVLHQWTTEEFPTQPQELSIWANQNIQLKHAQLNLNRPSIITRQLSHWLHPPQNVIKLNFDGASKGNPSKEGYRGIFKNHEG